MAKEKNQPKMENVVRNNTERYWTFPTMGTEIRKVEKQVVKDGNLLTETVDEEYTKSPESLILPPSQGLSNPGELVISDDILAYLKEQPIFAHLEESRQIDISMREAEIEGA